MPEKHSEINISRVRRAIDFWDGFTGGERLVAGVIADHFNIEEGYAFPSYRYLEFVYGFSQATISSTVSKLRKGLMTIDRAGGNNRYKPDPRKVESVLARLEAKRAEWKVRKPKQGASRGEAGASREEAGVLREVKPNVQRNAQPKDQHIPDEDTSGVFARSSQGKRARGADRPSSEKQADKHQQTVDEAERDWVELNRVLPGTSEDAEHQPGNRSNRGAKVLWFKLLRSGVASSQILHDAESYASRQKRNGQWLAGVAGFLAKYDPEMREDGSYPDGQDDSWRFRGASGDGVYSGGQCDPAAPF